MESGVEDKSGGSSIENSKKQRSLDLQTLYKSGDLNKGKFSAGESDIDARKKKKKRRKSIKEVSLDKPEPSGKKSRSSTDEDHVNGLSVGPAESLLSSSKLERRLNYSNGLSGFSLSLDSNGNAIPIPKRPRGLVGRRKFDNGRGSQSSRIQTSVIGNGKIKGEPEKTEGDQVPKKCTLSGGDAKSDEQTSKLPSHSAGNGVAVKVKRKISVDDAREKKKDKATSIRHAKEDGHLAVNNGEASSRKHRSIGRDVLKALRKDSHYYWP